MAVTLLLSSLFLLQTPLLSKTQTPPPYLSRRLPAPPRRRHRRRPRRRLRRRSPRLRRRRDLPHRTQPLRLQALRRRHPPLHAPKFSLPDSLVDRRLTRMRIISPSNRAADFGRSLRPGEYIPVLRREVLDAFLRSRAARSSTPFSAPAPPTPAPISSLSLPTTPTSPYLIRYTASPSPGAISGVQHELPVDFVIDADGANSRVARSISAGDYTTAIAFRLKRGLGVPEMRTCDTGSGGGDNTGDNNPDGGGGGANDRAWRFVYLDFMQ